MQRHIIHKQKVILHVKDEAGSQLLQETVSRLLHNGLAERIEDALNNAADANELIRIDNLVVEMNAVSAANFESDFKKEFIAEFEKKLVAAVRQTRQANDRAGPLNPPSLADSLLYFLQHGVLPWHSSVTAIRAWEQEIIKTFSDREWQGIIAFLNQNHKELPASLDRLILQFSDILLKKLLLSTSQSHKWDAFYKDVMAIDNGLDNRNKFRHQVWLATFRVLFKYKAFDIPIIISSLAVLQPLQDDDWLNRIQTIKAKYAGDGELSVKQDINELVEDANIAKKPDEPEDVLYVQNSGIILLNPFLQLYFQEIGLLTTNYQFIDDTTQKRAVLLLHYLATGNSEAAEYELALQKVLCGLSFEDTLPANIELTGQEKEEAANLLTAVIQHWQPLNHTSVEGLQVTFLQREGKLSHSFLGWRLQIEPKTVDILLGKLSWAYSTIKLPWMKKMINTDWYQ
ncbi:MAG: contractile injection system tape measure protein [Mucilaginibacter sp.]